MEKFLKKFLKYRIIKRDDNSLYMTRYYLFRKPRPWLPSIYIHCFHSSDHDKELHSHPWVGSLSLILKGKYREEYKNQFGQVKEKILSAGHFNFIPAHKFHRIDLLTPTVWTLFISGSKQQRWSFWNRDTDQYVDWEIFTKQSIK